VPDHDRLHNRDPGWFAAPPQRKELLRASTLKLIVSWPVISANASITNGRDDEATRARSRPRYTIQRMPSYHRALSIDVQPTNGVGRTVPLGDDAHGLATAAGSSLRPRPGDRRAALYPGQPYLLAVADTPTIRRLLPPSGDQIPEHRRLCWDRDWFLPRSCWCRLVRGRAQPSVRTVWGRRGDQAVDTGLGCFSCARRRLGRAHGSHGGRRLVHGSGRCSLAIRPDRSSRSTWTR